MGHECLPETGPPGLLGQALVPHDPVRRQEHLSGPTGHGNPWLKGVLGEVAAAAARTDTFLGARYRRLVKHMPHKKALVAVARSILVIVWHFLADPGATYQDLGPDWHQRHINPARKTHDLVRELERLGHQVTPVPDTAA